MNGSIAGKVVVITGASSGIGEVSARHLAAQGALVSLGARRKPRLDALADEIRKAGGKVHAQVTDVVRRADVESRFAGLARPSGASTSSSTMRGSCRSRPSSGSRSTTGTACSTST